jgi:hypothetical protein
MWWPLAAALALVGSGCGGRADLDAESKDPNVYARSIKTDVLNFVKDAKENPRTIVGNGSILLEKLQAHPSHPVGDNKATYEALVQKCKELVEAARTSGAADVNRKLEEMSALANKLPG